MKRAMMPGKHCKSMEVDTSWYSNFKQANVIKEQYHFGYWLNFYSIWTWRTWPFAIEQKPIYW